MFRTLWIGNKGVNILLSTAAVSGGTMGICSVGGVRALNTPAAAQDQLFNTAVTERAVRSLVGVPPLLRSCLQAQALGLGHHLIQAAAMAWAVCLAFRGPDVLTTLFGLPLHCGHVPQPPDSWLTLITVTRSALLFWFGYSETLPFVTIIDCWQLSKTNV